MRLVQLEMPLQGLQAWLAGPQVNLREGASSSAIVLAVDQFSPSPAHLRRLTQQVPYRKAKYTTGKLNQRHDSPLLGDVAIAMVATRIMKCLLRSSSG